jgi:hypothetical protein
MASRGFLSACAAAATVITTSLGCGRSDPQPPWNTQQMWKEVETDLRRFERLSSGFISSELLAWKVEARDHPGQVQIALVWGQVTTPEGL